MPLHPRTCSALYSVSCILDALDGYAARRFKQSTKFGAVLDMVTDRCTTACLLVFLASAFPRWSIVFQGLISLDLASHYMHMYATLSMGGSDQSHKKIDEGRSWVLKQYYSNNVRETPPFPLLNLGRKKSVSSNAQSKSLELLANLFLLRLTESAFHLLRFERAFLHCALPPVLLLAHPLAVSPSSKQRAPEHHARHTCSTETVPPVYLTMVSGCYGNGKVQESQIALHNSEFHLFNCLRIFRLIRLLFLRANKLDSTVPWILAAISFPVMAGKQIINVIQLVKASKWLAEGDRAERKRLGLKSR
jgi:CDP-diacylglycerol--inositol 3-phosphatidyltransferase